MRAGTHTDRQHRSHFEHGVTVRPLTNVGIVCARPVQAQLLGHVSDEVLHPGRAPPNTHKLQTEQHHCQHRPSTLPVGQGSSEHGSNQHQHHRELARNGSSPAPVTRALASPAGELKNLWESPHSAGGPRVQCNLLHKMQEKQTLPLWEGNSKCHGLCPSCGQQLSVLEEPGSSLCPQDSGHICKMDFQMLLLTRPTAEIPGTQRSPGNW